MHSTSAAAVCGVLALLGATGCPGRGTKAATDAQSVRVRSFTDASPIRLMVAAPPFVFSASDTGLDRWDLASGEVLPLSAEHALPGDRVQSMTPDPSRGWIWVATSGGVTRYDSESGSFTEVPPAPQVFAFGDFSGVSLAPASDGGLWLGSERGLFYTNTEGKWTNTAVDEPITALHRDADGWLWIGAASGLIARAPSGKSYRFDAGRGCDIARVRFIVGAPDRGAMVVGEASGGAQRVLFAREDGCASFRASPERAWDAAASRRGEVVVLAGDRLYSVRVPSDGARRLRRNGIRLLGVGVGGKPAPRNPYILRAIDMDVPGQPTALAAVNDEILIGTTDLGIARLIAGRRRGRTSWLRRADLVSGARALSVACAAADDCYIATGTEVAWRFDGQRFARFEIDGVAILAFVRAPDGQVFALHRAGQGAGRIEVASVVDGASENVGGVEIETPGGEPELTFARFSPSGLLWLGLRYRDDAGELRPYGVALADLSLGAVAYHHASRDVRDVRQGVLPIPINAVDVSFMENDEVWLATSEGAARVRARQVSVFSEAEGLRSELLRGIACSAGGMVFVASGQGVGLYDGEQWRFPRALRWPVNDIEIGPDGRLWLATDRGVAVFDGARVRRLDRRRGLIENDVEDVIVDHRGWVWARSQNGLTIIAP